MTSIREEVLDNPINISKFKFTCDDADDSIPKPLPQQGGFAMLIIGKPRSGKTNLLLNLTTKAHKNFNRKFDKVYLFSPSVNTMENDPFELLPDEQKFEVATQENLLGVLEEIKDTGEKVLMILDDCISDIRGKGKSEIENLLHRIFFNRRILQVKVVVYLLSQQVRRITRLILS